MSRKKAKGLACSCVACAGLRKKGISFQKYFLSENFRNQLMNRVIEILELSILIIIGLLIGTLLGLGNSSGAIATSYNVTLTNSSLGTFGGSIFGW
jgi:hypothetical protein